MYFFEGLENLVVVAWFFWAQIKEFFIENYFEKHHWTKQKAVSWAMYIKIWGYLLLSWEAKHFTAQKHHVKKLSLRTQE